MLSEYFQEPDRLGVLEFFANFYAALVDFNKITKSLSPLDPELKIKFDDFIEKSLQWIRDGHFDDPRDLKAAEYGYKNF